MNYLTKYDRKKENTEPWVVKLDGARLQKTLLRALNNKLDKKTADKSSFTLESLSLTKSDINNLHPILQYFLNKGEMKSAALKKTASSENPEISIKSLNSKEKDYLQKTQKLNIDKVEFVQLVSENQNFLKTKFNTKAKVIEQLRKIHTKFELVCNELRDNMAKYTALLGDGFYIDELCQSYTVPDDTKILDEIELYANYYNDLDYYNEEDFEEIKDIRSINHKLKFEFDISYTQQILKIEQRDFNFVSESPNQNQIHLQSNFDDESFLLPLMPPLNSIIQFNYYSPMENKSVPKKLEVILDFKLQYATRLKIAEQIMQEKMSELTVKEYKLKQVKSKILFYETLFKTEIFTMKDGIYDKLHKKARIDCANPFGKDSNKVCLIF